MEEQFKKIKTEDPEIREKHLPVVSIKGNKINVKVGDVEHPSEPEHFIQWIEIFDNDISLGKTYLSPFAKPEISFVVKEKPENLKVRVFCNLHGTWEV